MKEKEVRVSTPYGELNSVEVYELLRGMVITACKVGGCDPDVMWDNSGIPAWQEILKGLISIPYVTQRLAEGVFYMEIVDIEGRYCVRLKPIEMLENNDARILN